MVAGASLSGPRLLGLPNTGEASMDELLLPFDPACHLSKLSSVWKVLKAGVSSFDEAFDVCIRCIFSLSSSFVPTCLLA